MAVNWKTVTQGAVVGFNREQGVAHIQQRGGGVNLRFERDDCNGRVKFDDLKGKQVYYSERQRDHRQMNRKRFAYIHKIVE